MKKIRVILVLVGIIIICGACSSNHNCPAYADNSIELEQNI